MPAVMIRQLDALTIMEQTTDAKAKRAGVLMDHASMIERANIESVPEGPTAPTSIGDMRRSKPSTTD
jgi:hypothetical protein